ncbi:signal peptidase I [Cellvibrio japonicus]|uniref:Signal peptidase I n=1 Tax=Cellvibrio japonicus (strain Ueda107) TaxID=498211 RepID=B3PLG3_CELJU|nr:signal peptidase I [Cellvibrio japonicus]ACE85478.1 signal peptidase I [Cellvibrio japonicus Ueda107]QEI12955.1 signal peptidase I [Cellvibrio japonicus]QEI16529.1 signal peptidase I [Cellvibrio japonicus]QEI20107.1 signal peptidase I [Cellvibrio japonicus]
MSINLPLILTLAVLVTGLVWLLDAILWAKPRKQRVSLVDKQFASFRSLPEPEAGAPATVREDYTKAQEAYASAREAAAREPILVEYSKSFFPVLFIVFFVRSFLVEPFQIPSGSMIPTLKVGDFILVNKYTYGIRLPVLNTEVIPVNKPEPGDVMVFFPPHAPDTYYIKRVIGVPGDRISYVNHVLTINGQVVPETLVAQLPPLAPVVREVKETINGHEFTAHKNIIPGPLSRTGSWVVPEGHYFMMGDNRDNSLDSRDWGFVSEDQIVGKAFAVWMHWDKLFSIPSFGNVGMIQ